MLQDRIVSALHAHNLRPMMPEFAYMPTYKSYSNTSATGGAHVSGSGGGARGSIWLVAAAVDAAGTDRATGGKGKQSMQPVVVGP